VAKTRCASLPLRACRAVGSSALWLRPLRPRKRASAQWVATPSASQARQRSTGGDPFGLACEAALQGFAFRDKGT
jgi:hypothetical protein